VLEVIAGYDPQDELTAFSIGRLPSKPYRSFANERTLNGMRIGVIREHMDKKLFSESHVETIDIVERGINDLRGLGAIIVDPGPGGRCFRVASTNMVRSTATGHSSSSIRIYFLRMPTRSPRQTASLGSSICFSIGPLSRPAPRSATSTAVAILD
jgi:Asp-tRNA(Asn)/Glu-tRNA(Gln) amidotransferase A subunit family amidase